MCAEINTKGFLPLTAQEMKEKGWEQADFVYVIGDAYVDHSSFGHAIISRVLERAGYKVAIISQPDWHDENSIDIYGEPRIAFLVSAGNMDSMVNHYTVNKKRRSKDSYSPGGQKGHRPDYATIVYCNLIKRKYKKKPVIIGGVEASLRRLAHYDYWSGKLKRSILLDSGADLLLYGMGEKSIVAVAEALESGLDVSDITFIPGTVYKTRDVSSVHEGIMLPEYDAVAADKRVYAESFAIQYKNTDSITAKPLVEKYGEKRYVVQNPPSSPLTTEEMDDVYELPFMNTFHPSYRGAGGVPAIAEIKFSLTSCRGCFGGCNFCALAFHQGRRVQARSVESLTREAKIMIGDLDFKGYIHDVGGPTANFRGPSCEKQVKKGVCTDKQCLFPEPCKNLKADHTDYIKLLRRLRNLDGVKKVFIRSGVRFDYVLADKKQDFIKELYKYHISGQLRTAPEHVSDKVLSYMGKPRHSVYEKFCRLVDKLNEKSDTKQYIVPYLMSSHPGCGLNEAIELAEYIRDIGFMPEQVQDFYPTPSTLSTVMYYTGLDPRTMEVVYVPDTPHEKAIQRALMQYSKPENYELVKEALVKCNRTDLIGFDRKHCLIPPRKTARRERVGKKDSIQKSIGVTKSGKKEERKAGYGKDNVGHAGGGQKRSGKISGEKARGYQNRGIGEASAGEKGRNRKGKTAKTAQTRRKAH